MGLDLFNTTVLSTYDSLIKVGDNDTLTGTPKLLSDGRGNDTPIWLGTNSLGVGVTPESGYTFQVSGLTKLSTVIITSNVTANSFIKSGGLSSQFLKADGSVDANTYQNINQKGLANGYAPLDSGAKISEAYLPDSIVGQLEYQGTWNASTNTPTLPSASTVKGHYYVTSAAGTYETIEYAIGDWVISNGTSWEKVDNTDAVTTVFGRIGAIVANSSDYSDFYHPLNGDLAANASTATTLQTARLINGTSFNGSANITTAIWGTSRTITIGDTGKSLNGSTNVTWSRAELGITKVNIDALNIDADTLDGQQGSYYAAASSLSNYLPLTGGNLTGDLNLQNNDLKFQGSDSGDIVWYDGNGIEEHRIWDGGINGLNYRYQAGATRFLMHTGNYSSYITKTYIDGLNVDADTLDNLNSTQFLRSDTSDTMSGTLNITGSLAIGKTTAPVTTLDINGGILANGNIATSSGNISAGSGYMSANEYKLASSANNGRFNAASDWGTRHYTDSGYIQFGPGNANHAHIYTDRPNFYLNKEILINNNIVWNAGNDGSSSGLDADLLDGQQGSYYDHRGYTVTGNYLGGFYTSGGTEKPNSSVFGAGKFKVAMLSNINLGFGGTYNDVLWTSTYNGGDVKRSLALVSSKYDDTSVWIAKQNFDATSWGTGHLIWNSGNDGSGSGLDADLLDGLHSSSFFRNGDTTLQMANNDGLVYNDSTNLMYVRADGSDFQIIDTRGGTLTGTITASGGINMINTSITGVNHIVINDAGVGEGIEWSGGNGWKIYESPDSLTNAAGNLQFVTGSTRRMTIDTSGNVFALGSSRAPIFYDSDNTGYYTNPASTSNLNQLDVVTLNASNRITPDLPSDYGQTVLTSLTNAPIHYNDVNVGTVNTYLPLSHASARYNSGYRTHMNIGLYKRAAAWGESQTGMYVALGGNDSYPTMEWRFTYGPVLYNSWGYVENSGSFRAPIFYDSDNTAYYLNPASGSYLNYLGVGAAPNTSGSYVINMGGNIDMNNNGIDYASQLHFNSNVRFYQESNDSYLNFKYGDAVAGGIRIRDNSSAQRGVLYASTDSFGLLDNDGSWALRTRTGTSPLSLYCDNNEEFQVHTSYTLSPGSSRAPLFYDSDNTGYYVHGSTTSRLNILNVNAVGTAVAGIGKVLFPYGAEYNGSSSINGALKITLPQSWTNTMMSMKIVVFEYATNQSFEISCGGYNYTGSGGTWINTHAKIIANGKEDRNFNIRFGHDGTKCCIYIGETTTNWSYPKVVVTEWIGGHAGETFSNWDNGWDISPVTSLGTITRTETNSQIGRYQSIIYDVNDTGYYLDPAGVSNINQLHGSGKEIFRTDDNYLRINQSASFSSGIWFGQSNRLSDSNTYIAAGGNGGTTSSKVYIFGGAYTGTNVIKIDGNSGIIQTTTDSMRAPIFYDYNDTGYYLDPTSTSRAARLRGEILIGPNTSSKYLRLGGNGGQTDYSTISTSNGNLHIDSTAGFSSYINHYSSGNVFVGAGGGYLYVTNSVRSPIFYDVDNTGYYTNPASTSVMSKARFAGGISVNAGGSDTAKHGISLYSTTVSGKPSYGMLFTGIAGEGTHGSVTGDWATYFTMSGSSTTRGWIFQHTATGNVASISTAGNASFNGDVIAYFSDMRLKTKLGNIENPIQKIQSLNGFYYEPNEVAESYGYKKERKLGLSAQEVEAILPEIVTDAPIGDGYKTVDYAKLVPVLIEAIKEQQKQIDELKQLINK